MPFIINLQKIYIHIHNKLSKCTTDTAHKINTMIMVCKHKKRQKCRIQTANQMKQITGDNLTKATLYNFSAELLTYTPITNLSTQNTVSP